LPAAKEGFDVNRVWRHLPDDALPDSGLAFAAG